VPPELVGGAAPPPLELGGGLDWPAPGAVPELGEPLGAGVGAGAAGVVVGATVVAAGAAVVVVVAGTEVVVLSGGTEWSFGPAFFFIDS
jgi:hypothetical protein